MLNRTTDTERPTAQANTTPSSPASQSSRSATVSPPADAFAPAIASRAESHAQAAPSSPSIMPPQLAATAMSREPHAASQAAPALALFAPHARPQSAQRIAELRGAPAIGDYHVSLRQAAEAKVWADSLEDAGRLGQVTSTGFGEAPFDLRIELFDAMVAAAHAENQVLRDFAHQAVCARFVERNSEPGDVQAADLIKDAENNSRYFLHAALQLRGDAAGYVLAIQSLATMSMLRINAQTLNRPLPENIDAQLAAHRRALDWPWGPQLAPAGLTELPEHLTQNRYAVFERIDLWRQDLGAAVMGLLTDLDAYAALAQAQISKTTGSAPPPQTWG